MSATDPGWPLREEHAPPPERSSSPYPSPTGYPDPAGYPAPYPVPAGYPAPPARVRHHRHAPSPEAIRDAQAAINARRELGADYDDAVAAGLADRVEELVAFRLADQHSGVRRADQEFADERLARGQRFALGIVSLGVGIPVTAIAAMNVQPGLLGIAVAWAGIIGVNWVFNVGTRIKRRRG